MTSSKEDFMLFSLKMREYLMKVYHLSKKTLEFPLSELCLGDVTYVIEHEYDDEYIIRRRENGTYNKRWVFHLSSPKRVNQDIDRFHEFCKLYENDLLISRCEDGSGIL